MRELTASEMLWVAGGSNTRRTALDCNNGGGTGNNIGGVSDSGSFGQDLINIYEGMVAATSYVFERVFSSF